MRNRAMNPPILADKHLSRHEDVKNDDFVRGDNTDEDEDDGSSAQLACRFTKTPRDADPKSTIMKYYPLSWQSVLEMAKNNMRKHIAVVNAFLRRDTDLKDAMLILKNTMTEYERIESNSALEPGNLLFVFLFNLLVIDQFF